MQAIKIKQKIESETLTLPILKQIIGKEVEIIFLIESGIAKTVEKESTGIHTDWRDKMKIRPKLLVVPDKLIEPIADIWEGYV